MPSRERCRVKRGLVLRGPALQMQCAVPLASRMFARRDRWFAARHCRLASHRKDFAMKRMHLLPLAAALLTGTVFAATTVRAADKPEASVPVLVGGITKDDEAAMQHRAHQWPMRLVFSERRDNEFVADVDLV